MQDHIGMTVLSQVERSLAGRRETAQEAYDAFEFDARIVASHGSGFFFSFHKQQPVMARKIHVLPEDGGHPIRAFFCVAFEGNSTRVVEAFAFTGQDSYFGHLPADYLGEQPDVDDEAPRTMRM